MIENPRILGILPARAGSKGLPGKNLMTIGRRTLIEWSGLALMGSKYLSRGICSTDSLEIKEAALRAGLTTPFMRPQSLSEDSSPVLKTILHSLDYLAEIEGESYDYVVLVQATCPTVLSADIDRAIEYAVEKKLDCVFTAYRLPFHSHPAVTFSLDPEGLVSWSLDSSSAAQRRQDWEPYFARVGLVYVFRVKHITEQKDLYSGRTGFIEVEESRSIGIDTMDDFERAKTFMEAIR
jgi:CMP-N-acetylneuraminic acid synthetase